jgi:hypothetical protein
MKGMPKQYFMPDDYMSRKLQAIGNIRQKFAPLKLPYMVGERADMD